jgi:hypothetical protein
MRHLITVLLVAATVPASAQQALSFESGWDYSGAGEHAVGPFLGREALRLRFGGAVRPDVSLQDGTIDFDAATRDPNNPKHLVKDYTIRDNLHPNDVGYKVMADAIDLSLFK